MRVGASTENASVVPALEDQTRQKLYQESGDEVRVLA